mmetsp:Transcript_21390/g.29701  ORF Transcript_21390/g.29701 Transcript_21390/m.29701 type:complete len:165 (-) Transcript_21390:222-716(-)|eukprot:CAMPEP_0196583476 /NCGR_PEP_ID=MMETSP1081-20130531/43783_1 /TAXON_ID=36882 /ORGANISM="Pyramimonas amylifera, Strain CCMP720" /LENGTH=164 /DNA_ID=CAMNT_0041904385 /DNA_START=188 /DNA_END=682 /DNA_ORIENTATION=-
MNTFEDLLASRGTTETEFQRAQNQNLNNFDLEKWEILEKQIDDEVQIQTAKWKQNKLQATSCKIAMEEDEDGDEDRLHKLDQSGDDSDEDFYETEKNDMRSAITDLEKIKKQAKLRLEEAKRNATLSFEKQKKAIHVYAHPASIAYDVSSLATALGRPLKAPKD